VHSVQVVNDPRDLGRVIHVEIRDQGLYGAVVRGVVCREMALAGGVKDGMLSDVNRGCDGKQENCYQYHRLAVRIEWPPSHR